MSAMDVNDSSAAMDTESAADGRPASDTGFRPMNPGQSEATEGRYGVSGVRRGGVPRWLETGAGPQAGETGAKRRLGAPSPRDMLHGDS